MATNISEDKHPTQQWYRTANNVVENAKLDQLTGVAEKHMVVA
jgi:hypothetical protein